MKTKKILALALAAVLLVAVGVSGTLAWLAADTEPVTNTFQPTTLEVGLNESDNLDFTMIPGDTIAKDPKVTYDTDVKAWLFVEITESDNLDDFITYGIADGWTLVDGTEYVYSRVVEAGANTAGISVIKDAAGTVDKVTVNSDVTKKMMDDLTEETYPKLTFKAYIIQYTAATTDEDAWNAIADPDIDSATTTTPEGEPITNP